MPPPRTTVRATRGPRAQAARRSLFTAFPWSLSHIALFTASAITGSGIAMACAQAGNAADYENPDRARWYARSAYTERRCAHHA